MRNSNGPPPSIFVNGQPTLQTIEAVLHAIGIQGIDDLESIASEDTIFARNTPESWSTLTSLIRSTYRPFYHRLVLPLTFDSLFDILNDMVKDHDRKLIMFRGSLSQNVVKLKKI